MQIPKTEMPKRMSNAICKQLRGAGLPKKETLEILNLIQKWYRSNGMEWTVDRLKGLHHWYITYRAGSPVIPTWFKHTKDGRPVGVYSEVFKMKNLQRALAVMSVHTVFVSKRVLVSQATKELKALAGSDHVHTGIGGDLGREIRTSEWFPLIKELFPVENHYHIGRWVTNRHGKPERMRGLADRSVPNLSILSGDSIPCGKAKVVFSRSKDYPRSRVNAYIDSLSSIPSPTLAYMVLTGNWKYLPPAYDELIQDMLSKDGPLYSRDQSIHDWFNAAVEMASRKFQYNSWLSPDDVCGHLSVIQQESLKARFVANTHRVTNYYLGPLADEWYDCLSRVPTDCTFEQSSGVQYVQGELRSGHLMAGSDLSSATDLLDVSECMDLVQSLYFPDECSRNLKVTEYPKANHRYHLLVNASTEHFIQVAKGNWYAREKLLAAGDSVEDSIVHWRSGQPLGSIPSFAMLGLTNNALGIAAAVRYLKQLGNSGVTVSKEFAAEMLTGFRVQGDDIILRAEISPFYNELVEAFGGEINLTKTITSSKLAEFAGRVITPSQRALKRIKSKEINDFQFLEVVDSLGPQSVSLLRPMQRDAWRMFKYIPGIAVPGPFPQNSQGAPFADRYQWYLDVVETPLKREHVLPDSRALTDEQLFNQLFFSLAEDPIYGDWKTKNRILIPRIAQSDFQSDAIDQNRPKSSKDPTKATFSGRSTLRALQDVRNSDNFVDFDTYRSKTEPSSPPSGGGQPDLGVSSASSMSDNTKHNRKPTRKNRSKDKDFGYGY